MLQLRLFGEPMLQDEHGQARQAWRTHVALLAYLSLAVEGRAARSTLAGVFWPDVPEEAARRSLRQALFQLRRSVGEIVAATGNVVRLETARIKVDVHRFEQLLAAGRHREAIDLYAGEFLTGFSLGSPCFDEWSDRQRVRLTARAAGACAALSDSAAAEGRWAEALHWAEGWAARDPFSEGAAVRLIALRAQMGDRGGALAAYESFRTRLRDALGVPPGPDLEELVVRIGRSPAAAPVAPVPVSPGPPDPRPVGSSSVALPLVGREAEFARLHRCWERARAGERQFVLITGEAGIGKTRLAQDFADWAALGGATVLRGRAYEVERGVPYATLSDVLRGALDAPGLAGLDAASLAELSRIVPEFATRFPNVAAPPAADLETGRVRLLEALRLLFDNVTFEAPALLLLDDLASADDATLAALHYLWRGLARVPLLVVATARSLEPSAGEPLDRLLGSLRRMSPAAVGQFTLEPLGVESITELAGKVGIALPDKATAVALQEETGGNPLFVGEALRARLEGSAGAASATVRAVINERVMGLTPSARELLRAAAVIGRRFPFPFAAALAALPQPEAIDALEELLVRRLLHQVGYEYDFLHDVVREAVYQGLGSERRRLLHRLAFERLTPGPDEPVALERASRLAMHAWRGGLGGDARHWLLVSAEHARQLFAGSEAERFLEQALEATDTDAERGEILEQVADVRFAQSRFADAARTYHAVIATTAPASTTRLRLRIKLLDAALRAGLLDLEGAAAGVSQLASDARAAGPSPNRDLLVVLANAHLRKGDPRAAEEQAMRAVDAARAAGDPRSLVHTLLLRAQAATLQGPTADVLPVLEEAVRQATEHALQREICDAQTDYATELCRRGRWDEATALWGGVITRGERAGAMGAVAVAGINLADVLLRRGEWTGAAEQLDRVEELARRLNFQHITADVLINRAMSCWLREASADLIEAARAALAFTQVCPLAAAERNARALQLLGLLARGRDAEARREQEALALVGDAPHSTWSDDRELVAIARARFEAAHGSRQTARRMLGAALKDAGDAYAAALLQLELAALLREEDPPEGQRLARLAAATAAHLRAAPLHVRATRLLDRP